MTFGRLKNSISSLAVFLLLAVLNLTSFGQVPTEIEARRAPDLLGGEPSHMPTRAFNPAAIDFAGSRIASEGYDRVWQMTGPFGGDVTAMAIDPRNADNILLGTSDGQIYRSTDGGSIWRRIRPGLKAAGFAVTTIHFDREKPGVLYAGLKAVTLHGESTKGGSLCISEDNGESWREFEGLHGRAVRGVVQSTGDANVLIAATYDGIYRSMDRGRNWNCITPENDPELRNFHSAAIDPRDPNIIYVGTSHLPWKTLDGGVTWKRAGSKETGMIDDSDIMAIHIDEANPDIVLMSACSGIYRSLDASAKWAKIQGIPYSSRRTHVIYQHPTRPEVIYAGTTEGLWLSTNSGKPDSWRRVTSLRLVINAIAIHPNQPDRVFLGTEDNGVLISNDGGETYELSNAGFINRQVRAVLADGKERNRVYAGVIFDSANGGLFVSEDGGLTWQQSMNGMGVRDVYSLYQSPSQLQTIYAGTNHGLFRSDDHGINWAPVKKEEPKPEGEAVDDSSKTGKPEIQPSTNTSRPRRVKEPAAQTRAKKSSAKVKAQARKRVIPQTKKNSRKRGKKPVIAKKTAPPPSDLIDLQSHVFGVIPFKPIEETSVEADQPQTERQGDWMLASTWDGLFRSEDEKKGWKPIKLRRGDENSTEPVKQPRIYSIATSPHAPGLIMAGTEEGLFISRDNGKTFSVTTLDEETSRVRVIVFDPRNAETIYVGSSAGFFRSLDGGATWERRGGGMPLATNISAITINQVNPDQIYIGDDIRGMFYHSKDRGKNWEKLDISQLPSTKVWSLSTDPFDQNKLYVGSFSGGVYVMSKQPQSPPR